MRKKRSISTRRLVSALLFTLSISLVAGSSSAQTVRFGGRYDLLPGLRTESVSAVDLDGDGQDELIVADTGEGRVFTLRRDATQAGFTIEERRVGPTPTSLAAGDFDLDGRTDVAVALAAANAIAVLSNDGSGRLLAPTLIALSFSPHLLAAADFTGDGVLDLLAAGGREIALVPGLGPGGFDAPRTFALEDRCAGITAADLDADGRLDLAIALADSSRLAILHANGVGFDPPTIVSVCIGIVQAVSAVDVDGDGNVDLISSNGLVEDNGGSFYDLSVFLGDGEGSVARSACLARSRARRGALLLANVGGDGQPDLVVANPTEATVTVLLKRGDPRALSYAQSLEIGVAGSPFGVAATDIDADGLVDLVVATDHGVTLIPGSPSGPDRPPTFVTGVSPTSIVARDVTRDGLADLVTADTVSNTVSLLVATGGGSYGRRVSVAVPAGPTRISAKDLNGDGISDFVSSNSRGRSVSVILSDGGGRLTVSNSPYLSEAPGAACAIHLDGDRRADLVVAGTSSLFTIRQLPGDNLGLPAPIAVPGIADGGLAVADVNGDEIPDVIVSRPGAGVVTVLLGSPSGGLTAAMDFAAQNRPTALATGDLDDDGDVDVVVGDGGDARVTAFLNDSTGVFSEAGSVAFPAPVTDLAVEDVDADGNLDVVGTHFSVAVALGDGTGGFGPLQIFGGGTIPSSIACRDLDGDGDVDIATADSGLNTVSILLNSTPPRVDGIAPSGGAEGTRVFVDGARLGPVESLRVRFGDALATSLRAVDADTIVATAPSGLGTVDVTISNGNGTFVVPRAFTYLPPDVACRAGDVNGAIGPPVDVLTVNGSAGSEFAHVVKLGAEEPFTIEMASAPSRAESPFALYVWRTRPTPGTPTPQMLGPISLGTACLPTPLSGGSPAAFAIWNNLPDGAALGAANRQASLAPTTVFRHKAGRMRRGMATLQGFIADDRSPNAIALSLTNAVIIAVE